MKIRQIIAEEIMQMLAEVDGEQVAAALSKIEELDAVNLQYLNRLSDALFVWSRWVSNMLDHEENLWSPNR